MTGIWVTDCVDSSWAWLDLGCIWQKATSDFGAGVTAALEPVWIILGLIAVLLVVILFAPNTKHFIPLIPHLA